jgi:hypothetical protein
MMSLRKNFKNSHCIKFCNKFLIFIISKNLQNILKIHLRFTPTHVTTVEALVENLFKLAENMLIKEGYLIFLYPMTFEDRSIVT